jgi:hypothetical protein
VKVPETWPATLADLANILSMSAPQNDGQNHAGEPVDNSDQIGKVRTAPALLATFGPAKIPPAETEPAENRRWRRPQCPFPALRRRYRASPCSI